MSNKQQSSIDDKLREIIYDLRRQTKAWQDGDSDYDGEDEAIAQIKQLFEEYYGNS